jgi:hypothetical protein
MAPGPTAGLCDRCRHQQLVPNTRGSVFSLCLRSRTDPAFPRYPRLPVLSCPGFEPGQETAGEAPERPR